MCSRVGPRCKRGPRNRRLGRARRGNPAKSASRAQSSQVWQLARFEQPRYDAGVQTVQTDDNDLLDDANLPVVSMIAESVLSALPFRYQITHSLPSQVKPYAVINPRGIARLRLTRGG
jgi:hypothetical protein